MRAAPGVATLGAVDRPASITVLLFATLRERAGQARLVVDLPAGADASACWDACCRAVPGLRSLRDGLRVARNREYVGWDAPIASGDEVAFLPPVSGGAPSQEPWIHVGPEPIDVDRLAASLGREGVGGVVTFVGVVRDPDDGRRVPALTYEAYLAMADSECREIAATACRLTGAVGVAVQHRVGRGLAGEPSVAVVAAAAHRDAAFAACRQVIDAVKERAPIWKRAEGPEGPC